jgi:integrase
MCVTSEPVRSATAKAGVARARRRSLLKARARRGKRRTGAAQRRRLDRPRRWACPFRQLRRRLDRARPGLRPKTTELYRYLLHRHLSPTFDTRPLAAATDERYRVLVLLAAFTSLRWGELAALRRSDIDAQAGTVRVTRQLNERDGGGFSFGPPKPEAGVRSVAIPELITPDLAAHIMTYARPSDDGLIFTSPGGGPLKHSNFRRRFWVPARAAAGLPAMLTPQSGTPRSSPSATASASPLTASTARSPPSAGPATWSWPRATSKTSRRPGST